MAKRKRKEKRNPASIHSVYIPHHLLNLFGYVYLFIFIFIFIIIKLSFLLGQFCRSVFEGFVRLLALPRLTYIYQWQNLFRVSLSSSHSPHTHPGSPIFSFIYWYSFFNSHFFVANPEHCVIMLIHSYNALQKSVCAASLTVDLVHAVSESTIV